MSDDDDEDVEWSISLYTINNSWRNSIFILLSLASDERRKICIEMKTLVEGWRSLGDGVARASYQGITLPKSTSIPSLDSGIDESLLWALSKQHYPPPPTKAIFFETQHEVRGGDPRQQRKPYAKSASSGGSGWGDGERDSEGLHSISIYEQTRVDDHM